MFPVVTKLGHRYLVAPSAFDDSSVTIHEIHPTRNNLVCDARAFSLQIVPETKIPAIKQFAGRSLGVAIVFDSSGITSRDDLRAKLRDEEIIDLFTRSTVFPIAWKPDSSALTTFDFPCIRVSDGNGLRDAISISRAFDPRTISASGFGDLTLLSMAFDGLMHRLARKKDVQFPAVTYRPSFKLVRKRSRGTSLPEAESCKAHRSFYTMEDDSGGEDNTERRLLRSQALALEVATAQLAAVKMKMAIANDVESKKDV